MIPILEGMQDVDTSAVSEVKSGASSEIWSLLCLSRERPVTCE